MPGEEPGGGSGAPVVQQQVETVTPTPNLLLDESPQSDFIPASSTAALLPSVPTSSASIVIPPTQDQQQSDGFVSGVGVAVPMPVSVSQPGSGGPTPPHHSTPENTYTSDHQARLSQQNSLEKYDSVTSNSNLSELARKLQQLGTSGGTVTPISLSSSHTFAPISAPSHPGTPISLATQPTFSQDLSMQLAGGGIGGSSSVDSSNLTSMGIPIQEANVMQLQGYHHMNRTTDMPSTELFQQVACEVEGTEGLRTLPLPYDSPHMHPPGGALTIVVTPPIPPLSQTLLSHTQGGLSMGIDERRAVATPAIKSESIGTPLVTPAVLHNLHAPAGVLMTAPMPCGVAPAAPVANVLGTPPVPIDAAGMPISADMFSNFQPIPQPAINPTALQQISLQAEMSGSAANLSEVGASTAQTGHEDSSQSVSQSDQVIGESGCITRELGQVAGESGQVTGESSQVGVETGYMPVVSGHIAVDGGHVTVCPGTELPLQVPVSMCMPTPVGLSSGAPTTMPAGMTSGMGMTGAALGLPHGVMLAVPTGSGQRSRMDLEHLREQLQKLVPGAHLTLAHHGPEENVSTGSPSIDGLQQVYPQSSLNASQSTIGGIPLTMMGSNTVAHGEGLHASVDGSVDTSMILPQTVRLPGGETVALVSQVMMESGCHPPLGYSAMVPLRLENAGLSSVGSAEAYAWRPAAVSPAPIRSHISLSRTPSIKDSEDQCDTKQNRTSRFQVTKVVEEAVRRTSDTSTCSSPVSSPVRRGRFAVTKVSESTESGEGVLGGSALTPGLSESHPHVFIRGDSQGGTPSDPPSITPSAPPSMTSSFVSEDTPATTPATPAPHVGTFGQHHSSTNSTEDHVPTLEGSQFSGVVTRPPGDRWQPQSQPSSSSSALPMQTPLCEGVSSFPSATPQPHYSNTTDDKIQTTPTNKSSATNQQTKVDAFKNSKTTNFNIPVSSTVHGIQTLSQIVEQPLQPISSSSSPPHEPPPILRLPSRLIDIVKKKSHGIEGGAIPKISETKKAFSDKCKFPRSASCDADTQVWGSLPDTESGRSAYRLHCSKSVEVQTEDCKRKECYLSPFSPSLSASLSPNRLIKPKSTSNLSSPIPPPIPPRNSPPKSPIKNAGSINWLDRSSSIIDLGNLFDEVKQSKEALHKSRESLNRFGEKRAFSLYSSLSRTKSVSSLQHLGLAGTRDSGLSQSSWELGDANNSAPHFHSFQAGNSMNFNEIQKPSMLTSNIKRSPALRRLTGQDRLSINVEDSVYHTVHTPSHACASPRAKSSGRLLTPHTPAFQDDVYYTIQGGSGVTEHYHTEDSRSWQAVGSMPMHRQRSYCHSSSSSEEGFEEDDPLYEPLHESPTNMSPTETYNPHYTLEIPRVSPRSPKYYYHSPPHISHYVPLSPKSPKHLRYSPKSHHPYGHSPHQLYQSPQCSPQSSHYSPQSYHYPCTCMHQGYPNPLCSRPWPSPTAQLETGRSCSWTEDDELETVRLDLEDFSEDDDSFQQLLSKQEHEEAELRQRHQQEREAYKVLRMQRRHHNKRPKSLRLASSPGPPPSGMTPTSPHCQADDVQTDGCKLSIGTNSDSILMSDHSMECSSATTSNKKGRTISEDMLELVQNLGAPRPVARPLPGKITLNQMMAQQKSSATIPSVGQRAFYPSVGIAAAQYHGQYFSNFQTFPLPYQRLSDGSVVAVSQVDDGSGAPSSTSSSNSNLQQPPATSASWVQWQQQ